MNYSYKYPRPALTVDAVVFQKSARKTEVLLIQRKNPPFRGGWALPGGFVDLDETLEKAVVRELFEETGLKNIQQNKCTLSAPPAATQGDIQFPLFFGVFWKMTKNQKQVTMHKMPNGST